MKPDTTTAMRQLIAQVRDAIPFDLPAARACTGICNGCSVKLLDYLDGELADWEARLAAGERPSFGDLARVGGTSRKVYRVLARNGLVPPDPPVRGQPADDAAGDSGNAAADRTARRAKPG